MFDHKTTILISIKPEFVDLIFNGTKTVELRRSLPKNIAHNSEIVIYASSPIQSIVGRAFVKKIEAGKPRILWQKVGCRTGVSLDHFNTYFDGKEQGYGLILEKIERFQNPISLSFLRDKFDFSPPQSFMYARKELMECIG